MKTSDVIAFFESQEKAAVRLSISQSAVAQWGEYPPALRQIQIEALTGGKLKAEPDCIKPKAKSAPKAPAQQVQA